MEEYKPNSHKSREEKMISIKKNEKMITGTAKTKKKNELQKIADVFLSEDVSNVKSYIMLDVLVPAIKKALSDIVTNGIDMVLYGEIGHTKKNTNVSKIPYRDFYERAPDRRIDQSSRTRSGYIYNDIILDSRGEAEDVLSRMDELVSCYGMVRVADLYDLVGVTGNYTDNRYGWTDIRSASVVRVRDGYLIKMPRALPLT